LTIIDIAIAREEIERRNARPAAAAKFTYLDRVPGLFSRFRLHRRCGLGGKRLFKRPGLTVDRRRGDGLTRQNRRDLGV